MLVAVFPIALFLLGLSWGEVGWQHGAWSLIFLILCWTFCRRYGADGWAYAVAPLMLTVYFLFKLGLADKDVPRPWPTMWR